MDNSPTPLVRFESRHYITYTRGKTWYMAASAVAIGFLIWALLTQNFLFAFIVVIGSFIFFLDGKQNIPATQCDILPDGILYGDTLYAWKNLSTFAIVENLPRALIVRQKSGFLSKVVIPLPDADIDTDTIRKYITQYIPESERDAMSISESVSRIFKL